MKKLICTFMVLATCGLRSQAADGITVSDATIPQGGETVVEALLTSVDKSYGGLQFDVALPAGVSLVKVEKAERLTAIENYVLDYNLTDPEHNVYTVLGYNIERKSIAGTSGAIAYLTLQANDDLTVGSVLDAMVQEVVLSTVDAEGVDASNSSFTITIGEPDDGRLKFDENAATLPAYTAGEKADVTVKRTVKAGEWSTLVLPFNLTRANATAVFGDDVKFAKFSGFTVDYGDDEENVTPLGITIDLADYTIPARGNMAGGTPVLIKTSKDIDEIQLDQVTLTAGVTDAEQADEYDTPGKLTGTLVKSVIPEDGLFISGNQFWYSTGKTNVKAFRCWFELGAVLDKETDFGARVTLNFLENEDTGVSEIENGKSVNGKYYDLQGRRVEKPGRGVFVKDGKKVIIK